MDFEEFVLAAATGDLGDEPTARKRADAVEFRMDLASNPLTQLGAYDGASPLIVTNRAQWEGGEAPEDPARLSALAEATEHPAVEAVDVELETLQNGEGAEVVESARAHGVAVVASVHDFETTPGRERLSSLLSAACDVADVGKLAVTAESPGDVLALLGATWEATSDGRRVATMAMGEAGRHSRAVAPLYGSRIGYAPVDPAEATAPGQYDLATLSELVGSLRSEHFK
jgi:3-dehydroquinate dehydratase-1